MSIGNVYGFGAVDVTEVRVWDGSDGSSGIATLTQRAGEQILGAVRVHGIQEERVALLTKWAEAEGLAVVPQFQLAEGCLKGDSDRPIATGADS